MDESTLVKSARGSGYNLITNAATMVLGFIRSVLLMRLLDPELFGIVALSVFFSTIVSPLSGMGVDYVLIQNKDPNRSSFSTHFLLRIFLSIFVLLVCIFLSPILLHIYNDQKIIVYIFLILLLFKVLEASYSTQNIVMKRELRFGPLAILNLLSSLTMTLITPLLAYFGAGIWSLVAEIIIGPAVRWIGFWGVLHPWRPSFSFNLEQAKSMIRSGVHYMSSEQLGTFLNRFDDFWVGTFISSTALGYYSRAYAFAQYPQRIIATPIVNVFFPAYSAVQDNESELSKAFFRSSSFLIRSGFLLALILLVTAPELTVILFTSTWLPIVPIFRIMLIYILLDPFYTNLSYLIAGVGRPNLLTRTRLIQTAILLITVIIFAYLWDVRGVAVAANLMMFIGTVILLAQSRQFVSFSLPRMLLSPVVALLLAGVAGFLVINYIDYVNIWINLLVKGSVVSFTYLLTLYILERDIFHEYGTHIFHPMWDRIKNTFS